MKNKPKFLIAGALVLDVILTAFIYFRQVDVPILRPVGDIALHERDLMITAILLMLIIVVPLFVVTILIVFKYQEGNNKAKYNPEWKHGKLLEIAWWVVPSVLILILGVYNWNATHALDPYKSLDSTIKPVTIQVVALRWKWLFIYPDQNIATVNFVQFPQKTPINFFLTADAPMSSFWIPKLSGQMYAMTGMDTQLHTIANTIGDFEGSAAEINGAGFSGMKFTARASSNEDFDAWVTSVKETSRVLTTDAYEKLAKPSQDNVFENYSSVEEGLYNKIIMKYSMPKGM